MSKKIKVLELNNIDIYGKRFNGYSIAEYTSKHPTSNFDIKLLVNHKLGNDKFVMPLFNNQLLENADWKIDELEKSIGTKNQISLSLCALKNHPAYQSADILHFHMYHNMHLPIEFLCHIPSSKKIVLDLHDTFWLTDKKIPMLEVFASSNINKNSLNAQRKRVLNDINAGLIVHSPYMLRLFKESDATKNLSAHLIKFGVNLNIFKPLSNIEKIKAKYGLSEYDIILLFRTQKEFKGVNYIIKALTNLNIKQSVALLTVGAETGLIKNLSSKYHIKEFGLIDNESMMAELYNICDIFLAPSTEESFGFMAAEAMACKKPVIVFEGTALPDTVNAPKAGIAVPKSSEALKTAIQQLINNPKKRLEIGREALKYASAHYNEMSYIQDNLSLYKKLPTRKQTTTSAGATPPSENIISFTKQAKKISNFLLGKTAKLYPIKIDYNNLQNQAKIHNFNQELYYNIKDRQSLAEKIVNNVKVRRIIKKILRRQS